MNDTEARAWLVEVATVSRETIEQLEMYEACVRAEQKHQNLVSDSTLPTFWSRHIVDSVQLVRLANRGSWLDIGSGAGLPGIITAIVTGAATILVEPRARRVDFLRRTVERLGLAHVTVAASTIEQLPATPVQNITARAVAALPVFIEMALPFADANTVWLLPKGKSAKSELASLPRAWQGGWTTHASVTDPESLILVGRHVKLKGKR